MQDAESAHVIAVAVLTSATEPAVPDIRIAPLAWVGGSGVVPPAPCDSPIR